MEVREKKYNPELAFERQQKKRMANRKYSLRVCDICNTKFLVPEGTSERLFKRCSTECDKKARRLCEKKSLRKNNNRIKKWGKLYYSKNKDRFNRLARERNQKKKAENPELWNKRIRDYYYKYYSDEKNREKRNAYSRKKNNEIKNRDYYFRHQFAKRNNISTKEIPTELLEAYKTYIQLKREVRNVRTKSI